MDGLRARQDRQSSVPLKTAKNFPGLDGSVAAGTGADARLQVSRWGKSSVPSKLLLEEHRAPRGRVNEVQVAALKRFVKRILLPISDPQLVRWEMLWWNVWMLLSSHV